MVFVAVLFIFSCTSITDNSVSDRNNDFPDNSDLPEWLIPKEEVIKAASFDGIPAINNPKFITVAEANYLKNSDLVILIEHEGIVKGYPHKILDWHEMVNDKINNRVFAVSYCPLTGSGVVVNSAIFDTSGNIQNSMFGVSGLLYNSNLIYFDRLTGSYWSQMKNQSVSGPLRSLIPENFFAIEVPYKTVKEYYPDALILSNETGIYSKNQYFNSPYADYKIDNVLHFPVSVDDARLERKERVLGFLNSPENMVFRFTYFRQDVTVRRIQLNGDSVIVVGNMNIGYMAAFKNRLESGEEVLLSALQNKLPVILKDNKNNQYDMFGNVTAGPNTGEKLQRPDIVMAYWFSWGSMYPGIPIFDPQ